jgi:hypothetical protein
MKPVLPACARAPIPLLTLEQKAELRALVVAGLGVGK